MSEQDATPDPIDIFAEIEARRADEVFMERIKARAAEDGDLLQRIADDEMLIADMRARLSHAEAERDDQIAKVLRLDAEFQALVTQIQEVDRAKDDLWASYMAALRCIDGERNLRLAAADNIATTTRQTAADTVLAAARRLCCGDNPAPHHAARAEHSQRMAFAEELARAVRGS